MSSLNISKLRQRLINYKTSLATEDNTKFIEDAITLCNLFEALEQSCRYHDVGMVPQLQLHRTIEHFKGLYFPTYVSRTIGVKVKVRLDEGLARVYQIKNAIETFTKDKFSDVEEVSYDKDC